MKYQLEYLPNPWRRVTHTDTQLSRWEYVRVRGTEAKPPDKPNFQLSEASVVARRRRSAESTGRGM
jgi:hypothetical protein